MKFCRKDALLGLVSTRPKRKNGEVDIFKVLIGDNEDMPIYIDPVKIAVISYGDGIVEKELDDGTKLYNF